jgi:LPS-assembly protein
MAPRARARQLLRRQPARLRAVVVFAAAAAAIAYLGDVQSAIGQSGAFVDFPKRPSETKKSGGFRVTGPATRTDEQMLVRANELNYDYSNERVSAVGNVQIYHAGATLEADKVIYDQRTKRVHAEGNVRLTEPDGRVTYGEIMNLSDKFRDGFVDSLRIDTPEQTRMAATRADRSGGNITVLQSGVYTACEACADDPRKPPKWQIKSLRIIHDQGEQMMYFESSQVEFFGVPVAYIPFFSAPDPTAKRKSGLLMPMATVNSNFGFGITVPYYWALAPNYDLTLSPMFTTRQGPLLQGEWRHRLVNGAYTIRASGIFQLDRDAFGTNAGNREFRGDVHTTGQFRITDKWTWGWNGTLLSDTAYYRDYGFFKSVNATSMLTTTPDYIQSDVYLQGRGERSFFDARAIHFYGLMPVDDQRRLPVVHPVITHDYTFGRPVLGGEVSLRSNVTSLSRDSANFEPITQLAATGALCAPTTADPALKRPANCILRGVPGTYTRASSEAHWRRTIVDSYGQVFTPFASVRGDIATADIQAQPGVTNFMTPGQTEVARAMPTAGVEYRYPFINVQSWGTQTVEPIAQLIMRPDETKIGVLPNEDSQAFLFDSSNLFSHNKFPGWDRVEGGGRLNAGFKYTAQFNRGGYITGMFGQSYHLFGQNSFAVGGITNTGIGSGLDKTRSDYVASATYQPNSQFTLTSRFRLNETDFTLQRSEYEATVNFGRWSTTVMYGHYAAQPAVGFFDSREGITGYARFKVSENWLTFGGVRYNLKADQVDQTQIGVGYIDDCLILAMNYITEFNYTSTQRYNHTVMMQISLRTLGGHVARQNISTLGTTAIR